MKKLLISILILSAFFSPSIAQRLAPEFYWVQLKDKDGTQYTIDSPQDFLSPRTIAKRIRYGIPVTHEDLPVSAAYLDSIRGTGVGIHGTSRWFNSVLIKTKDSLVLGKISTFDFVEDFNTEYSNFTPSIQEGITREKESVYEGSKSSFYGVASSQMRLLSGNFLHSFGYRGEGMLIAVLDAGFYKMDEINAFRDLWEENRILAYKDFVDPSSVFFEQSTHGLAVTSTMAAFIPDTFVGSAPGASYLLLRSEEAARENKIEEANWILAAEYADSSGADVITSSLGYYDFPTSEKMNYSYADLTGNRALVTRAAEKAFSKGMVVVASAGNEGNDPWGKITPPSDGPNVLAVGSVDTASNITSFSSRGNTADGRIKPDVMAVGFRTKIINPLGEPSEGYGTSFAAPQIAGLIACLWQAVPEKTNKEIIEAVRKSSSQYSNPDSIMGYGIPDFLHALWHLKKDSTDSPAYGLIAYPNPSSGSFELHPTSMEIEIKQIDIFSSDGKLVHSYKRNWNPGDVISINSLKNNGPGIYYLKAHSTEGEIVTKLIRQ